MDLSSHGVVFCIATRTRFGSTFRFIMTHMSHDTQQRNSLDLPKKCSSTKCIFTLSSEPFFVVALLMYRFYMFVGQDSMMMVVVPPPLLGLSKQLVQPCPPVVIEV